MPNSKVSSFLKHHFLIKLHQFPFKPLFSVALTFHLSLSLSVSFLPVMSVVLGSRHSFPNPFDIPFHNFFSHSESTFARLLRFA